MKIQQNGLFGDFTETFTETESETILELGTIEARELAKLDIPPRTILLDPWLTAHSVSMIYAERGAGKSMLSTGISLALASNSEILGWKAKKPVGVLYLDGELPLAILKDRFLQAKAGIKGTQKKDIKFANLELQTNGLAMPDLCTPDGQKIVNSKLTDDIEVIVVDNISTLCRTGKENEAESWLPVQQWALQQRAKGRAVIFIHHSGKNGMQRGTSRREDALDVVIHLKVPNGHLAEHGASFDVIFEKARSLYGQAVAPFRATYVTDNDGLSYWKKGDPGKSTDSLIIELNKEGKSQTEIAQAAGVNKSTVSRKLKKLCPNTKEKKDDTLDL